jgi:hypothetical protein
MQKIQALLVCFMALVLVSPVFAAEAAIQGDPYPLNVCAVSGEELGSMGEPVAFDHQGED